MLAWALGGVIALLGAFTFAELGRLRPVAGGQYHVLRDAYGQPPAFLFVFCNLTAVQAGAVAIIAIICAQNLGVALHGNDPSGRMGACWWPRCSPGRWSASTSSGVRSGARLQDATVIAKLVTLGALVAVAIAIDPAPRGRAGRRGSRADAPLTFSALFAGVTLTLFAYGGWQQALWMAGEVIDARRTVPRAILLGVVIVVVAYLAAQLGVPRPARFRAACATRRRSRPTRSRSASPGLGRRIAAGAVAVSAFGVLNAQFLTGPRLTWAMARDGQFFAPFARLHPRFATPVAGDPAARRALERAHARARPRSHRLAHHRRRGRRCRLLRAHRARAAGAAPPHSRGGARPARGSPARRSRSPSLELLAIAGSVLQKDVRLVALTGLAWIGAAAITWALFFRRAG